MKTKPQTPPKTAGPRHGPWRMAITGIMLGSATLLADPPTAGTTTVMNYTNY